MPRLPRAALALLAGAWLAAGEPCATAGRCEAEDTETSLVQIKSAPARLARASAEKERAAAAGAEVGRIRIVNKKLMLTEVSGTTVEVLPLGGNYVVKAQPYFPPEDVVRRDARAMKRGADGMSYQPSDGRKVVPIVRLGTIMEGGMPHGPTLDAAWVASLETTVKTFAEEGVFVVLDCHSDAWASTNGGEGYPYWLTKYMQETDPRNSYVVSPEHPLKTVLPTELTKVLNDFGLALPVVSVVDNNNPWFNYSIADKEPWKMNVGNLNMRANNNDDAWSAGVLPLSVQSNNIAGRMYNSYAASVKCHKHHHYHHHHHCHRSSHTKHDREKIFEPYVAFIKHLTQVWKEHPTVVAVELMNEPPVFGLPNVLESALTRRDLFEFYGAVLEELHDDPAVLAIEDVFGSVPGASPVDIALGLAPVPWSSMKKIQDRAARGQLMISFHYYYGIQSTQSFADMIKTAQKTYGDYVLYLSEYWDDTIEVTAQHLSQAAELGVNMVTYWQYADSNYTGNDGWYKYPPSVVVPQAWSDNLTAWDEYSKTVADNTYWGAAITGASGAKMDVLALVKNPLP